MINSKHKLIGDIRRYVKEGTKKLFYDVKNNTNKIRTLSTKISRLEKLAHEPREFVRCEICNNKIKEK